MELTESDAKVFFKEGMSDAELDEHDDAIKNYDKAIELDPNDPDPWNNKGELLDELGKEEEANKCFDKVDELEVE